MMVVSPPSKLEDSTHAHNPPSNPFLHTTFDGAVKQVYQVPSFGVCTCVCLIVHSRSSHACEILLSVLDYTKVDPSHRQAVFLV